MTRVAFVHVGAPKTGTTYLQGVAWANAGRLRDAGVLLLGGRQTDHYSAGHDLRELPYDSRDTRRDWRGAFEELAREAGRASSRAVLLSDEHLAALTPQQVARAVEGLAPREVHVIYTARDLAGLFPSEWQEFVKHRSKLTYEEWATRVLSGRDRAPGRWFWKVHDAVGVIDRWTTAIPPENFHLITMPTKADPDDELWRRFCSVLGVDPTVATEFAVASNTSLGQAETELVRRVNEALPEDFPRWHNNTFTRDLLATRILSPRSNRSKPSLPEAVARQVAQRADDTIAGISASGCDVVGDLEALRSPWSPTAESSVPPTDGEVLDAAVVAVAGLIEELARVRDAARRPVAPPPTPERPTRLPRLRARVAASADRHASVRWAVAKVRRLAS